MKFPISVAELRKRNYDISMRLMVEELDFAVDMKTFLDFQTNTLVIRLRRGVYGETLSERIYKYPADWWQAFKERWFPKDMLDSCGWSVEYRTFKEEILAEFPGYEKPPGLGPVLYRKHFSEMSPEEQ